MTSAGRSLAPDSSEDTNSNKTTSPRLQAIVRGIALVVPELGKDRIGVRVELTHGIGQIAIESGEERVEDVLSNGHVALRRGETHSAANSGVDVETQSGSFSAEIESPRHPCTSCHPDTMVSIGGRVRCQSVAD